MLMIKELKQFPEDVVEMHSKFYNEFQQRVFHLDTDKKLFDWASKDVKITSGEYAESNIFKCN